MKKSIIYLGITLVLLSTTRGTSTITSLSNKVLNQNHNEIAGITKKGQMLKKESIVKKEISFPTVEEAIEFFPEVVLGSYQPKAAHEVITENNRIIENFETNEVFSLELDYSIIDQIAQDNAIIESKITNEYQPLDFEIINCI